MLRWILMVALLVFSGNLNACEPEPGTQHFPTIEVPPPRIKTGYFKVYNQLNRLPCNSIRSLLVHESNDQKYVIAGTHEHGIMVFDGQVWLDNKDPEKHVDFPDVTVTSLAAADKDLIYAGTSVGLISIRIKEGVFSAERIFSASPENLNVTDIQVDKENPEELLIACDRSAGLFANESYGAFNVPDYLTPSGFNAVGKFSKMSLAGWSNGLFEIVGSQFQNFFSENDPLGWVTDLQTAGKFLYASSSNGVFRINEKRDYKNLLPGIWASCLTFTADPGDKLDGSTFKDFEEINEGGISPEETLAYNQLLAEHQQLQSDFADYVNRNAGNRFGDPNEVNQMWDRFNSFSAKMQEMMANGVVTESNIVRGLWTGTQDSGVIVFATNGRQYHLTAENSKLPSDQITCITSGDGGEVWIGTENAGILRYSRKNQSKFTTETLLTNCKPVRIRLLSDLLFICTQDEGLIVFRNTDKALLANYNSKNTRDFFDKVNDVAIDPDGNIWVAGREGLKIWNGKTWSTVPFLDKKMQDREINLITIDAKRRIFVSADEEGSVSDQIYFYNGKAMIGLNKRNVALVLSLPEEKRQQAADQFGLTGDFMRTFNFGNASETLNKFDSSPVEKVSALMNTEYYLIIGTESGNQYIFDGESYKKISQKGTGALGRIRTFARLPGGEIVIQGSEAVSEFNGQHYKLINSPGVGGKGEITDMILDTMNPETYRVSFKTGADGGYCLYQEPIWVKYYTDKPVLSIAQADKTVYLAKPEGVFYLEE